MEVNYRRLQFSYRLLIASNMFLPFDICMCVCTHTHTHTHILPIIP
jgi:hypothetical protein